MIAGQTGIVVEVSTSLCRVTLDGRDIVCGLRGSLSAEDSGFTNVVTVGDQVIVPEDEANQGIVEAVLPRRSILARHDVFYTHLHQVIVANADQVLIGASWREPHLWPELIDRTIIAAERNRLLPTICINKIDLAKDVATCRSALQPYVGLGYRVIFTSVLTGEGIGELENALWERTSVLAGMSGVGKSSLLRALGPGLLESAYEACLARAARSKRPCGREMCQRYAITTTGVPTIARQPEQTWGTRRWRQSGPVSRHRTRTRSHLGALRGKEYNPLTGDLPAVVRV